MRQTELVSASRVAILEQLSASIGEINQPICALVLNAEAALQLLLAQPTNTGAVRRLLACIVKEGLRTGDIVRRTRALIETAPPVGTDSPRFGGQNALRHSEIPRKQAAR
jgi:C4-dicarboxylate-specific signal transduction histidine kinase